MVKAILMDVDDTILDFDKNAKKCADMVADMLDIDLPEGYMAAFHKNNEVLWHYIQEGTLTIEQLHQIRWKMIFEEIGIKADYLKFELLFVDNLKECAIEIDHAYEMLEYLYGKYPMYIASNATHKQQVRRLFLANMDKYFEDVYTSESAGYSKPRKEFFEYCLKGLNVKPEEVVMIGDSISADISGAKKYGLKTIWYNAKNNPKSEFADYTIKDLLEIKNIL